MSITDVPGVGPALRERVAEEVRALMGRRRTTGAQLARAIGVPQSSLSRKLTGRYALDVDDLEAIAAYFEIPVASLIPAVLDTDDGTIGSWFPTFGDVPVLSEAAA
jgi:transcriptional regulator with XRE-family HTH domain